MMMTTSFIRHDAPSCLGAADNAHLFGGPKHPENGSHPLPVGGSDSDTGLAARLPGPATQGRANEGGPGCPRPPS